MAMQKISDYHNHIPLEPFTLVVKSHWFIKPLQARIVVNNKELHDGSVPDDIHFNLMHDISSPLQILIGMSGKGPGYTTSTQDHALEIELYYGNEMVLPLHRQGIDYVQHVPYIGFNGVWRYDTGVSWHEHWWNVSGKGQIY